MTCTLERLLCDVFALLGEDSRQRQSYGAVDLPSSRDIVGNMIASLLPSVGSRLIKEAPPELLGGGVAVDVPVSHRKAKCGLYAAEIPLPEEFLRLVSVRMGEWTRDISRIFIPGDREWTRQWSEESGIAGSPGRPHAYLVGGSDGRMLRMIGSEGADDSLLWFRCCNVPVADEDGSFDFPASLYGELVAAVAAGIMSSGHQSAS